MINYRTIFDCCGSHLTYHENANEYTIVSLDCHDCPDKMFCNRLKVVVENDINLHIDPAKRATLVPTGFRISRMR